MIEAARLTRAGDADGAAEMIHRALNRRTFAACPDGNDRIVDIETRPVAAMSGTATVPAPSLPAANVKPTAVEAIASEGRFVGGQMGQGRGTHEFKLFVPAPGADASPRPLVVMLHGCAQDPDIFAAVTSMNELAGAQNLYVLYPAQSMRGNSQGCWNWSKPGHQKRDVGEPRLLVELTRRIIAEHGVDDSRVYVAGFSAGGAMAAILGQAYPDIFAAVAIHSDDAPGATNDLPGAFADMKGRSGDAALLRVPTIMFHGNAVPGVGASSAEQSLEAGQDGRGTPQDAMAMRFAARAAGKRRTPSPREGRAGREHWIVHGVAHAWGSGEPADPGALRASTEMLRFFLRLQLARCA